MVGKLTADHRFYPPIDLADRIAKQGNGLIFAFIADGKKAAEGSEDFLTADGRQFHGQGFHSCQQYRRRPCLKGPHVQLLPGWQGRG